jgi:hypothetical protein
VEALQTLINALVVGAVGLILARMTQNLRQELKAENSALQSDVRREINDLRSEIREMRSDLTRVALAVGAERRTGRQ